MLRLHPSTRVRAKRLRRDQTDAEQKLWMRLRARQIAGLTFRRQQPVGRYIVDFCCLEKKLIIELDGGHHAEQTAADDRRANRTAAARALDRYKKPLDPLIHETLTGSREAREEVVRRKGLDAIPPLIEALTDKNPTVRQTAVETLGGIGDHQALEPLITF